MRKTSGALLVLAGLGLAVYALFPDRQPPLAGPDDFEIRLPQSAPRQADVAAKRANVSTPAVAAVSPVAASGPTTLSAPAVVTVSPQSRSSVRLAVPPQPRSGVLTTDRSQLARELQRELRRVGCYDGEINGGWTTSTKRAMKTFTERMNASLPVEEPDLILLTLVQGQPDKTCGRPCPTGESAGDGGRCVPTAVTSSQRKPPPGAAPAQTPAAIGGWSASAPAVPPSSDGRTALVGDPDQPNEAAADTLPQPAGLTRQPTVGPPINEARGAMAPDRGPSRRFDAQSFFKRMDKHSAN
jgi:hypothetical protein